MNIVTRETPKANNVVNVKTDEPTPEAVSTVTSGYVDVVDPEDGTPSVEPITGESTVTSTEVEETEDTESNEEELSTHETTDVTSLGGMENLEDIEPIDVNETPEDLKEALKEYGVEDAEDAVVVLNLVNEYKETHSTAGMYDKCPESLKKIIDGIVAGMPYEKGITLGINRKRAIEFMLENLIHDAQFSKAMDDYTNDMANVMNEMNEEYNNLFKEAIDATFEKLDEIKAENPEQAERIQKVKDGFEDANNFDRQKEYLKHTSLKKLKKKYARFSDEVSYFNKKVNSTSVKVPPIQDCFEPLRLYVSDKYTSEEIGLLLTAICVSCYNLDVENNIYDLAYIYRFVNNIYSYKFSEITPKDAEENIFTKAEEVLDIIKSL